MHVRLVRSELMVSSNGRACSCAARRLYLTPAPSAPYLRPDLADIARILSRVAASQDGRLPSECLSELRQLQYSCRATGAGDYYTRYSLSSVCRCCCSGLGNSVNRTWR